LVLAALVAFVPSAGATTRSPHLESSCSSGYTYGEHTFVNWTVEGCSKDAIELTGETKKRYFRGNIEVNGMVFEISDSGPDLTAVVKDNGSNADTGNLKRTTSTTIVLDPLVNGTRKRFVMYTGTIDLTTRKVSSGGGADSGANAAQSDFGSLISLKPAARRKPIHEAAAVGIGTDYVDIPTSGAPKIFGLSLKNGIHDAAIRPQNGSIAASTVFNAELALGTTGLSDLLKVNVNEEITLTDGTGMVVTNLRLNFPTIEVPGIGGLEDFFIRYDAGDDTWNGGLTLDLGELFPEIEFEAGVSASTGALSYIRSEASNLSIPIGATGIVLDSVRMEFGLDPLLIDVGADATAGPKIGGTALILLSGDIRMEFEPSFRLEVTGGARVLPSGNGELASGGFEFIYDADGLIAVSGDARFEAAVFDIGIGAQIEGSGAYSTTKKKFNIEASATGELLLGPLGDFPIAHAEAVVSSNGFGTCAKLLGFLSGGIGQEWGENLKVFTGCDLSDFDAHIAGTSIQSAQGGAVLSRTFPVARGTKQVAIELASDRPGPHVTLRSPDGSVRLTTATGERREVDPNAVVVGKPDASMQVISLRNPPAGDWKVEWGANDPQITGVRTARDVPKLAASVKVTDRRGDRAGRRRIAIRRTSKLGRGERVLYAIRTRAGLDELGSPSASSSLDFTYDLGDTGTHEIVAIPFRDGIPIASRKTVLGRYRAALPARPASILKRRRGTRLTVLARVRRGAEAPDAWQYRFTAPGGRRVVHRGRVGRPLTISVPRRVKKVAVTARPVLRGRALR
jgi:hypothetical protein